MGNRQPNNMIMLFQKNIGYKFKNDKILITALTHSSYSNENKSKDNVSNERLEFLGDAVLNIIISNYIFSNYPQLPEGELTRVRASVVCEPSLAECAKKLEFGKFLLLGKGEEMTGGRDRISILSDTFEAVLAAIYVDGGIDHASQWVLKQLTETVKAAVKGKVFQDYKTQLQEYIQKGGEVNLQYDIVKQCGPDHNKEFYVEVSHNRNVIGSGKGRNKKEAEQSAAQNALEKFLGDRK